MASSTHDEIGRPHEPLQVLYRDEAVVAVVKPAGIPVHRTRGTGKQRPLLQMLRDQLGQWVYPVHRLDQPTSGAIVFALSSLAAQRLSQAFRNHDVEKEYLAVVRGYAPDAGRIDHPVSDPDTGKAHPAVTRFRRLETVELPAPVGRYPTARYSLVSLIPFTGRRHQLRRHMRHIAHPVIGDTAYGDGRHNRFFRNTLHIHRLMLAATRLRFLHPVSGARIAVTAPLDAAFQTILLRFDWQGQNGAPP
jgi:tRNA pseudouridine65 synthase